MKIKLSDEEAKELVETWEKSGCKDCSKDCPIHRFFSEMEKNL